MVRPYSLDLRERFVSAVSAGASCCSASRTFGVSVSSVVRWSQRARETGSAAAHAMGSKRPWKLEPERDWLLARVAEKPDLTLHALLADRGPHVCCDTLWRFLKREGVSFKKNVFALEQNCPEVARKRARWKRHQARIDPTRLVFIDETWARTDMIRSHGWCARGKPLNAKAPHGHWRTMTFIAVLRCDRMDAPLVLDGPVNGEWFTTYACEVPAPTLRPGDVVVMDNLSSHKGKAVRQAIRDAGARLLFLPPYSPDLNPIEQVFSKLKRLLRKAEERTVEATWRRIGEFLDHFSPNECQATSGMQGMPQSKSERL